MAGDVVYRNARTIIFHTIAAVATAGRLIIIETIAAAVGVVVDAVGLDECSC